MKQGTAIILLAFMVFGLAYGVSTRSTTANPAGEPRASRIAVINMTQVVKSSKLFIQSREELKGHISSIESEAKELAAGIKELDERLSKLQQGTVAYDDVESVRDKKQTEFEEFRKAFQQRILQLESEIYVEVHRSVVEAVAKYADAEGIDLVIQYNPDQGDETKPEKIMESLKRPVIYQKNLDITDKVIAILNSPDE